MFQEEHVEQLIADYHEAMGGQTGSYWDPALERFVNEMDVQLHVSAIRVALRDACALLREENRDNYYTLVRQDYELVSMLCKRSLEYTIDDIRDIVQVFCNLIRLPYNLFMDAMSLLHVIEFYMVQPAILTACRDELELLYRQAADWGIYQPVEEAYRLRLLLGDLLFGEERRCLVSLVRRYATDTKVPLEEQAQELLLIYHEEMGRAAHHEQHPALQLIRNSTSAQLQVCLIRAALKESSTLIHGYYLDKSSVEGIQAEQNAKIVSLLFTKDLSYTIDDIQDILHSIGQLFSRQRDRALIDSSTIPFLGILQVFSPLLVQPEGLAHCRAELEVLYQQVSAWRWSNMDSEVYQLRQKLRKFLFPQMEGELTDLLNESVGSIEVQDEEHVWTLFSAYHKELGGGQPPTTYPLIQLVKKKLDAQSCVRVIRLAMQEANTLLHVSPHRSWHETIEGLQAWQNFTLVDVLCERSLSYVPNDIRDILHYACGIENNIYNLITSLLCKFEVQLAQPETLALCRTELEQLREVARTSIDVHYRNISKDSRMYCRYFLKLSDILSGHRQHFSYPLLPDSWGAPVIAELAAMEDTERTPLLALLNHCAKAKGKAPTKAWEAQTQVLVAQLGTETFIRTARQWISFFGNKKSELLDDDNADVLRGLIWCCMGSDDRALASILADAVIEGYRKISGLGPRLPKAAGACVTVLESMPGMYAIGQLERVRLNVKQPSYQAKIEQVLDALAQRENMSRTDLEELTVPTFDLEDGQLRRVFGSSVAQLTVVGRKVQLQWYGEDGKPRKSVPVEVKRSYKEELKEVKRLCTDIESMLSALRDRLEHLPLIERHWSLAAWRERYLDHPLLSLLARRLIWRLQDGDQLHDAIWHNGQLVNVQDQPLVLPESTQVSLWHPIMSSTEEVQQWRLWLERRLITQPFKQAHREVYILTDAERTTRLYSNRFAAHILRQHQFHALAIARGWDNSLRLMVDSDTFPASFELPHWQLRTELWTGCAGGDEANETGTYLYVTTDQIRFYPSNIPVSGGGGFGGGDYSSYSEPVPLEQIPPLVFSEVLRDVDLFVGVASIGNDPTWQDGGYQGYQGYWQSYSFGELSATAITRKELLGRLIPRLSIADRCMIEGRFLRVRGDLRAYKIHLGSSNILMEPDDQYLCIVPDRKTGEATDGQFFLPFEGDSVLALILSKAFLLAEDQRIKDQSIINQIRQSRVAL